MTRAASGAPAGARARPVGRLLTRIAVVAMLGGCSTSGTTSPVIETTTQATAVDTGSAGGNGSTTAGPTTAPHRVTTTAHPSTTERPATTRPAPPTSPPPAPGPGAAALATLARLPLAVPDWSVPYDRAADFGHPWIDVDHNGCDTRNDILHRDLTNIVTRAGTHGCVVISGVLHDPYSGATIDFVKARASEVQIDHVVALHAAWALGAFRWSPEQRIAYANDPVVLRAVSGAQNQAKSDDLADEWTPPNAADRCAFAVQVVGIHAKYALPVSPTEKPVLIWLLGQCR